MADILRIKDSKGNWISPPVLKGEDGYTPVRGVDYWTQDDEYKILNDLANWFYINDGVAKNQLIVGGILNFESVEDIETFVIDVQNGTGDNLFGNYDMHTLCLLNGVPHGIAISYGNGYIELDAVQSEKITALIDEKVPSWAQESNKPKYTATEVGAYGKTEVDSKISVINGQISSLANDNQVLATTVEGLQQQMTEEAHFRGYLSTNAKIKALEATPNDFAYSAESGTKWVCDAVDGWKDTGTSVPDQLTPASDTTPLMNGEASHGTEEAYARGDHRHPTDTTRVSVVEFNALKSDIETALDHIIAIQNSLIGGDAE